MKEPLHNMFYGAPPIIHRRAKELRGKETKAEKVLWRILSNRQLGVKFRRQHPISQYICDFYCHEIKLVIEVDGGVHDLQERKEYDLVRNEHLRNFGLHVMRFKNPQIIENIEQVLSKIRDKIKEIQ